jgi:uncharacterized protein (DUF58 family)
MFLSPEQTEAPMSEKNFPDEEEIKSMLFSECRALEYTARKWADARISGAYKSIQKGSGIEFEEARLYTPGDDARRIDWKVSARKQQPYIKSFREDRDQSLIIITDVSPSCLLGVNEPKIRKIGEICAFLASIAVFNGDAVGGITFFNDIISYTPPKKGFSSTLRLLHSIYKTAYDLKNHPPLDASPSLNSTLVSAASIIRKKSIIFLVSDFNTPTDFSGPLEMLGRKHDVYAVRLQDPLEENVPGSGIFAFMDPETGRTFRIDFSSKSSRDAFSHTIQEHTTSLKRIFSSARVPYISLSGEDSVRSSLFTFFQERSRIHA